MKKIIYTLVIFVSTFGQAISQSKNSQKSQLQKLNNYTFELSEKVIRQKVTFKNRYGIILSGDLYAPKNSENKKLSALAVSGPFGAVKEQSSGLYANQMAERGFIVIAFDPSFTGESGGETRNIGSPDINTEDFSAAVDFLGLQKNVDRNKIGIIGICGFGGFSLSAAAVDKRIKAVATTSMYDMSRVMAKGWEDKATLEEKTKNLERMSIQRWKDAEEGETSYRPSTRNEPEPTNPIANEYWQYYKTPRGFHERAINSNGSWANTSSFPFMNFPLLTNIKEITPRPILIIVGENAFSKYFGEDAYNAANEPKELFKVKNAGHVDLYDKLDKIPFEKLVAFFNENLK